MDSAAVAERAIAALLKPRGYRKRARNWFRHLPEGDYQVVNLQKSSYGGGNCYLNLGWHTNVEVGVFRPENHCMLRLRAERTDVIPPIIRVRADGQTELELPGVSLLDDTWVSDPMSEAHYVEELTATVLTPVAGFMDHAPSIVDMLPFLQANPSYVSREARIELCRRGFDLPLR